jgi:hypothetical protein
MIWQSLCLNIHRGNQSAMAQIIHPLKVERHARLFELIRQRNIANAVDTPISTMSPAEAQLFRLQAERSIRAGQIDKLAG